MGENNKTYKGKNNNRFNRKRNKKEYTPMHFSTKGDIIQGIEAIGQKYYRSRTNQTQVQRWLENPYANINQLQDLSQKMTMQNGILKEFINYKSLILTQDHFIYPSNALDYKDKEEIRNDEIEVAKYLEKFNPKSLAVNINKRVLLNGEVYLYKRECKEGFIMQEMPNKICKVIMVDEYGIYRYGIDVTRIDKNDILFYPDEIVKAKEKYEKTKDKKTLKNFDGTYYIISENGVAFLLDYKDAKGLPYYIHLFSDLKVLENAKDADDYNNKISNYKIIHQKVPTDANGKTLMPRETITVYHSSLKNVVPDGVGALTTPMELKPITLGDEKLKNFDYVNQIKKTIYDNAGIADELFNGNARTKELALLSTVVDTLVPIEIQSHIESYLNYELRTKFKKGGWRVSFLPITFFEREKAIMLERENLAIYGSKKKYLATLGFTPIQALNILYSEDMLEYEEYMKPMLTAHTISDKKTKVEVTNDGDTVGITDSDTDIDDIEGDDK